MRCIAACTFLSSPIALRDKPYPFSNALGLSRSDSLYRPRFEVLFGQALRSRDSTRPNFCSRSGSDASATAIGVDDAIACCTHHDTHQAPHDSRRAPAPISRLSHWRARVSNNRLWKRKLQEKVDQHNHRHGRKPKGVSNKTMHERASALFRSFDLLRRLGYQLDPNGLAGRHIQVLVDYWTCNARVANLCRQHGVAMLERAHSAAYIRQQLSFLRVYANAWIGKPGMVHPLASYVDDPTRFTCSYAATKDRSWDGNQVEFKNIVEKVEAIDPRVAAQLA